MKKGFRLIGMCFVLTVILFASIPGVAEANELMFSVDGNDEYEMQYEIVSYIKNSRTMVPLRTISEALGHYIHWDNSSQTIAIDNNIVLRIGDANLRIKDKNRILKMDMPAEIKNGTTYVPVRFLSEALDHKVEYINYGQVSKINIIKDYKTRFNSTQKSNDRNHFGRILNIDLKDNEVYFQLLKFADDDYSPNGYHIVDLKDLRLFHLTNNTEYHIIDFQSESDDILRKVTKEEFNDHLSAPSHLYNAYQSIYYTVETKGAEIIKIQGFYVP